MQASGDCFEIMPKKIKIKAKKPQNLDIAIQYYQSGELQKAEMICRQILNQQPNNSEAWHILGLAAYKFLQYDNAIQYISKAIQINPHIHLFYNSLGLVYADKGMFDEAINNYDKVLALKPDNVTALNNLGLVFTVKGMFNEAVDNYKKVLTLKPDDVEVHRNLGNALKDKGLLDEAIEHYKKVLKLNPDAGAYCNLGNLFSNKNMNDEAIENYKKALALKPDDAAAYYNLGNAFSYKGMMTEAIENFRKALKIEPDFVSAYINMGNALKNKGLLGEAMEHYNKALKLNPYDAGAYYNLGNAFADKGMTTEAIKNFRKALDIEPDFVKAHNDLGITYLLSKDYDKGWKEYEWRLLKKDNTPRHFPQPRWNGSPLKGKTLLVYAEQGVGDEIMFASCLPDVISLGGHCVLECDKRLMPLFSRSFPEVKLIPRPSLNEPTKTELPAADMKIAIGSLPLYFRPGRSSFSQQKSYLKPDKEKVEIWRARFKELGEGLKVGISWQGGRKPRIKLMRSIPLEQWSQVFSLQGVQFINLQYGDRAEELKNIKKTQDVTIHDWQDADPMKDLDNFAAQIAALDLVISVDNSTVHMAGALGVPVWALLPFVSDWRWMQDFEDTPWYESVRLYRQRSPGDWESVLENVVFDLRNYVATGVMPGIVSSKSYKKTDG